MDIEQVEDTTMVLIGSEKTGADSKGKSKICYDKEWEDQVKVGYNFVKQLHATLAHSILFIHHQSASNFIFFPLFRMLQPAIREILVVW